MEQRFFWVVVAAFLAPIVASASAANLQILTGEVLLSRGGAYHAVRGSSELLIGDTLVSRPGSSAKITFSDGCVAYLGMGIAFTIEAKSPCASGRSPASETGATSPATPDAMSTGADGGWVEGTETLAVPEESQTNLMPYLLGAAGIGGIAVAASALGGGDNGPPVSP
ncbi:hypothetical protein HYPDE_24778 [Hyphomicrobium denitrificans 1NES1]|uniref:FecR protein domain-containing protein n=1 Tax=Hyphomicrobium denitrificans 1NES1 TaxID=670307 RepID=N0B9A0_9HYPH|nr:hypothetical protein [Hyphomicrobium denitrificans]AGK56640.1 hypothetical protein HYPDE_24778 [Hyphomicrobium denitrificans 1NES1]